MRARVCKITLGHFEEKVNLKKMQYTFSHSTVNKRGWMTVAIHVLIWMIVFLIPYIFSANMEGAHHQENKERENFLYLNTGVLANI